MTDAAPRVIPAAHGSRPKFDKKSPAQSGQGSIKCPPKPSWSDICPTKVALRPTSEELFMTAAPLTGVNACVFDAYGTLFDFTAAARGCRDVLGDDIDRFTALWRDKQLQYTWLRAIQGRHADFWQVTLDALDFTLETMRIENAKLRERLMQLYLTLDAFPEVPDVLNDLRNTGLKLAILSNGTPNMLNAAVKGAKLEKFFDAILSVEDAGVYKPHAKVYQLAVDCLRIPASAISFQSSNSWDAYAASAFGMQVVWCNRYGQRRERLPGNPDREIKSLIELPALIGIC